MFGKNNKKCHDNDGILWAIFIITITAVTFFVAIEVSQKNQPEIFSADPSSMTAASQNAKPLDVSVMIVPAD